MPSHFAHRALSFALLGCVLFGAVGCQTSADEPSIRVYCAASFRPIMERLAERFEAEQGVVVQLQFGGSNTLLSQIRLIQTGDVFLPAERSYLEQAEQQGLTDKPQMLGTMRAVIVSRQSNDHAQATLADWIKTMPRVAMALPEVAAIGHVVKQTLLASGDWKRLDQAVVANGVYKTTVTEVANDVSLGTADWGIAWNLVAKQHPELHQSVPAELADATATVAIAPLTHSERPELATLFVAFVANSDVAMAEWQTVGLKPISSEQLPAEKREGGK